jgi:hypothetical protein
METYCAFSKPHVSFFGTLLFTSIRLAPSVILKKGATMNVNGHSFPMPRLLILAAAVFFVLYNVAFIGKETFALGRVSIIFLFFWAIFEKKNVFRHIGSKAWLLFIPLPAVVLQFILVRDFGQLSRFIYLAYFSFFGGALLSLLAKSPSVALRTILIATTIQAGFLFFSFFSPGYRAWFDATILSGSNYDASYLYRAPGLSSEAGASLSVIQSLGVFAGWLLLWGNKYFPPIRGKATYSVLFGMLMSSLSCVIVGRTGLILSCLFLLLFLLSYGLRPRVIGFLLFFALIAVIVLNQFISGLIDAGFSVDFFEKWAFGFFTGQDETVSTLAAMPIPPLSIETFFGTGLQSIVDGNNPSGHDSGMVQAYFSMGIFFAFMLYCIYLYVLWNILDWLPIFYRALLTAIVFFLDIKEPFLFKYSVMFVLMTMHFSVNEVRWRRNSSSIASVKV